MPRSPHAVLVCLGVAPLLACADEPAAPDVPGAPASLVLSAETVQLAALGAVYPLHATVSDASGIALAGASVTWSSADGSVATVDELGRVEAVGVGETEVVASAGSGVSDTAAVVVTQAPVLVAVSPATARLDALGDSVRLAATVRDANGNLVPDAAVAWTSADEGVATIGEGGWAVAQANGTASVTAASGDASDEATVIVEQVVAAVEVSPAADSLGQGQTLQLAATAVDSNGEAVAGAAVAWSSSDPSIATVDGGGRVLGVSWGADVTLTATAGGVSGAADVHVFDQLTYTQAVDGNLDLYTIHADGSGPVRLTFDAAIDRDGSWSPDGGRIAFTSARDGKFQIWSMTAAGTDVLQLTADLGLDEMPSWSPDGGRIAWATSRDGDMNIYVMDADGTDPEQLTTDANDDVEPAWSPDGTKIAFAHEEDDGTFEIYVMNDDGSGITPLTSNTSDDRKPAWSPDGTKIAFQSNRDGNNEIYVMDADGSNQTNLTNDPSEDVWPAWSPDGTWIAFATNREETLFDIFIMNADGSAQVKRSQSAVGDGRPVWRPRG
ncbi:MAG: Ig-like domain-containing protein, partial [Gemmatimonadota bacterium]